MWLLLACSVPALTVPVQPPEAKHATAVPATRFVGPWALDARCDLDAAALLEAGAFAWRVVVQRDGELTVEGLALKDAIERWEAADASWASRCGPRQTEVLFALDARASWSGEDYARVTGALKGSGMRTLGLAWMLVADAAVVHPPALYGDPDALPRVVLGRTPNTWVVLPSDDSVQAMETSDLDEAVAYVVSLGGAPTLNVGAERTWGDFALDLDAFAARGVLPDLGVEVRQGEPSPAPPPPPATTRFALDDTLAVLALPERGSSFLLMQVIGTAGP